MSERSTHTGGDFPRGRGDGRAVILALPAVLLVAGGALYFFVQREHAADVTTVAAQYCAGCHNATDWDGGIAFDTTGADLAVVAEQGDEPAGAILERAVRKVKAGLMPPADADRPAPAVLDAFVASLEERLDRAAAAHPDPGAAPLSRLNRAEYRNAVRDLLAYDATRELETLPADGAVAGFDNLGDGLRASPTLIEAYIGAALTIARQAVGDRAADAAQARYEAPKGQRQDRHVDGLPLGSRGGFVFTHTFPLDAEYQFNVMPREASPFRGVALCEVPEITVALNGRTLEVDDPRSFRMFVPAGPQTVAVALLDHSRCAGVNDLHDVYAIGGAIVRVDIGGPFDASGPGDTPSRRAIFSCYPQSAAEEEPCAHAIVARLAAQAYRRPLAADSADIATLLEFYRRGRDEAGFEAGVQQAVARMLMSPQFVFQLEHEPPGVAPGDVYAVSDLELATRLSFFLWSSVPDAPLVAAAAEGRLSDRAELATQVTRMLADERSSALVENFAAQWLSLRELREALPQDPGFDGYLELALEQETSLLVQQVIDENRSVLDLLDSDVTFLNERLAEHYGIAGVHGSYMRPVQLPDDSPRRGLLGHGSWLTATSVADRTSPVIRGQWFVTHLLGAPVPTPPPGVEADLSDEAAVAREGDTLRERLERHRANPTCASCHRIMDPIGLALENFDLVGRWRDTDNGKPVDTSAMLIDGTPVRGVADLRAALLAKPEVFVTALTEKLLTYALGRVVDYRDQPTVRAIVRAAAPDGYKFDALVQGIVASDAFRKRSKHVEPSTATLSARQAAANN